MSIKTDTFTSSGTNRIRRYRQNHSRIDYYPSPDVLDLINHYLAIGNEKCIAGIVDSLVRSGHRAIVSGNGRK